MREGHSRSAGLAIVAAAASLFAAVSVSAQDGTGRSDAVAKPSVPTRRIARRTPPRGAHVAAAPAVRRVELGRLALSVNEGSSRVEISSLDAAGGAADVISVPAPASSLILRTLPAGTYRIAVSKYGFADETLDVEIADGKRRSVSVVLKPTLAVLNVGVSVPDAQIEVEGVGRYQKRVGKLYVKPGTYNVTVTRRGYAPRTAQVDLSTPGREENLQIVMQPMRIDEVLDEADDNAAAGNLDLAADLARDVLLLNAAHARANLIYGRIEMRRGGPEATGYLLRAVLGGETLRFPVKLQESRNMSLVAGELLITGDGISFKSPERFELDLTIHRRDVEVLNFSSRPAPGFVSVSGRSDFHGRSVRPDLKIHPHDIVVEVPSGTTRCGSEGCDREIADIARLLQAWRDSSDR